MHSVFYAARVIASAGTDAEVAVAAALAGAAVLGAMFGSALARFDKPGGDFATAADALTGEESGAAGPDGAERGGSSIRCAARTDGDRALVRSDGADEELAPSRGTRLVEVNLDPPFPNAPRLRAVSTSPPASPSAKPLDAP